VKILLITHSYAPDLTPRAFRWAAVAQQLAQAGHQVHVLCAAQAGSSPDEAPTGVIVHRVSDWLINASARVAAGTAASRSARTERVRTGQPLRAALRKAVRTLWRTTYWPDYACGWVVPATTKARDLCREHRYDWVVSISHPFSGHVAGWLAMPGAPGARWLVDIGDPFHLMEEPSPNNRRLYAWLNRWVESRIIRRSTAISVTTEATRALYELNFPESRGKTHLVPPLLSLPPVHEVARPAAQGDALRLVFVGTLYRRLRSPRFLLACFSGLVAAMPERRIELHFYGATNDCAEELAACPEPARSSMFVHGIVSRSAVHEAMAGADILVNIGNDSASQLASKVIEYMSVGRPILNIVSLPSDASLIALEGYSALLTLVRSETPSPEDLALLRAFVQAPPQVDPAVRDQVRARYSAAHIAGLYRSILEPSAGVGTQA